MQALIAEDTHPMTVWNRVGSGSGGSGWVPQGNVGSVRSRLVPEIITIEDDEDNEKEDEKEEDKEKKDEEEKEDGNETMKE